LFPEPPAPIVNQDNRTQIVTFQVVYDQPPDEKPTLLTDMDAPLPLEDGSNSSNGHNNSS
jgi:hypothetical protein